MLLISELFINNISYNIITDYNSLIPRIKTLSESLFILFPEVHIFIDWINETEISAILGNNFYINITFHQFGDDIPFLVGSSFESPEYERRIRNIHALQDILSNNKGKEWHFISTETSFVFPSRLTRFLSYKTPNDLDVFGFSWYFFDSNYIFLPKSPTKVYYDHNGGFVVSSRLLEKIIPGIKNCSNIYASPYIDEEVKYVTCFSHSLGDGFYHNCLKHMTTLFSPFDFHKNLLNLDPNAISYGNLNESTITRLFQSIIHVFEDNTGDSYIFNWEDYGLTSMQFELFETGDCSIFIFGYALQIASYVLYAKSPIIPVIHGQSFKQQFDNNITVMYYCDDSLESGEMVSDGLFLYNNSIQFRVLCPKPLKLSKNNNNFRITNLSVDWN